MAVTCTICDSPNARACTKCHSTNYCSTECQQTDWPSHSLLCSQYAAHTDRPGPSHKRAILFPPNETKPKFTWIECTTVQDDDNGTRWQKSNVRQHLGGKLGPYDAFPETKPIRRNILRDRDLADTLVVACRDAFLIDGSKLNKSIVKATHGAAAHTWKGPIVAMKRAGVSIWNSDSAPYLDIDMRDYRDVVNYFISYGDESVRDGELGPADRKGKIRGVKINCKGDRRTFGADTYSAVVVPRDHPVFYDAIAPISELVGMPVRTRKYPPDILWRDNHEDNSYENVPATWLHLVLDPDSELWGGRRGSGMNRWVACWSCGAMG